MRLLGLDVSKEAIQLAQDELKIGNNLIELILLSFNSSNNQN